MRIVKPFCESVNDFVVFNLQHTIEKYENRENLERKQMKNRFILLPC